MQRTQPDVVTRSLRPRSLAAAVAMVTLTASAASAGKPALDCTDCEGRLDAAVEALATHPRLKDVARPKLVATTEFTLGNMLFVLLHETAHGLISDLGLPVLGREEDAADAFAAVTMLKMKSEFTHSTLINAAKSWMISERRRSEKGQNPSYYDAHGLDLLRAYNIICLMVGSDADQFADLAEETHLPEDRRETCAADYSNASWSWERALKPYLRSALRSRTKYQIIHSQQDGTFDAIDHAFRATGIMERVGARMADLYVWRHPFNIEVRTCGAAGATWQLPEHRLLFCYELADYFVQQYRQHGGEPLAKLSPPPGSRPGAPIGFQ